MSRSRSRAIHRRLNDRTSGLRADFFVLQSLARVVGEREVGMRKSGDLIVWWITDASA
jgi:hypothetical protein